MSPYNEPRFDDEHYIQQIISNQDVIHSLQNRPDDEDPRLPGEEDLTLEYLRSLSPNAREYILLRQVSNLQLRMNPERPDQELIHNQLNMPINRDLLNRLQQTPIHMMGQQENQQRGGRRKSKRKPKTKPKTKSKTKSKKSRRRK
jgi:hypothetical protein